MDTKSFPITRYQGSKRKIISWINEILKEQDLSYETVLDGFGGSGSISYLFKKLNKSVTYNDNLRFNYLIGKALIENHSTLVNDIELDNYLKFTSSNSIVQRNFDSIYYLKHENEWIDNIISGIDHNQLLNPENIYKNAIAYYALFQSCLIKRPFNLFHRNNLHIRTNDVKRSFGNKNSWEKPFEILFKKFIKEANSLVFDNKKKCFATNKSIFEISENFDLVYLDPPYFSKKAKNETSNYYRCYHFLEGLANYNDWEMNIEQNSLNKRLINDYDKEIITRHTIKEKLEELILKNKDSIIVLSYKEGGIPSIEYLVDTLHQLNKRVICRSIHYKYALNHQNGDASKNREVLIIGI